MSPSLPILLLKVPYFSSYPLFDVLLVLNPPRILRHSNKSAIGISIEKQEDGPSYRVVNIMEEILTPELILDALKSNDTCTCSRCQADVKALMLTRLPPKYIVADNTTVPMLLTFYRNKFRVAVLSQSMRACMEVKEHPRHIL